MLIDVTLEFYHKKAIYVSKITKAKQPIAIKKVEVKIENLTFMGNHKYCHCIITSDKGIEYPLESLLFE